MVERKGIGSDGHGNFRLSELSYFDKENKLTGAMKDWIEEGLYAYRMEINIQEKGDYNP